MREPALLVAGARHRAGARAPCRGLRRVARWLERGRTARGVPVICIGDLTLGGAGKTPTAHRRRRSAGEGGEQPVFLTRGYGGRAAGPIESIRSS